MSKILNVKQLRKTYQSGGSELTVLEDISFSVPSGTSYAIVGPSGSGKTTLLGLCAGLDSPDSGSVTICDQQMEDLSEDRRAALRNEKVGFIFQNFQLLPTLTALENVSVPLELKGDRQASETARSLLEKVGLGDRTHHYPSQLSGGEQQRVALARAFANRPEILFADEPTGNLDEQTGERVVRLLFDLNKEAGTTLIIVTHDMDLARRCNQLMRLQGGRILEFVNSETV
jgi:putative ABC transport system ATP-binding protein